jgi:uncharacterized protein
MPKKSNRILLAGGSGLIGRHLKDHFGKAGYELALLTRKGEVQGFHQIFHWAPEEGKLDKNALEWADVVINLSGQNIGSKSWSKKRKSELVKSRILPTRLLVNSIGSQKEPNIDLFISCSAIGAYRPGPLVHSESAEYSSFFLGRIVEKWESEASKINEHLCRLVIPRIGIVLSPSGGALEKMRLPVRFGIGSPLGSGQQMVSWIHIEDLCRALEFFIWNDKVNGPVNLCHPQSATNKEFMKSLAQTMGKPFFFPRVPSWILKMVMGEMSSLVLDSISVSSQKILDSGFEFKFPDLDSALADLF